MLKRIIAFRYILLLAISPLLFTLIYYFDEGIRSSASFPIKVQFFAIKSILIFIAGVLTSIVIKNKWTFSKNTINPIHIVISLAILIGNIILTIYIIDLYRIGLTTKFIMILLNDDNRVIYSFAAGLLFGYGISNKSDTK